MNHILQLQSTSPDVVTFRMYYKPESTTGSVSTTDPYIELPVNADLKYDLRTVPEMQSFDGVFKVAFTSVDDGNLEGPMGDQMTVSFDFVAPNPPTAVFSDE